MLRRKREQALADATAGALEVETAPVTASLSRGAKGQFDLINAMLRVLLLKGITLDELDAALAALVPPAEPGAPTS